MKRVSFLDPRRTSCFQRTATSLNMWARDVTRKRTLQMEVMRPSISVDSADGVDYCNDVLGGKSISGYCDGGPAMLFKCGLRCLQQ